jgi:hypothetical protein
MRSAIGGLLVALVLFAAAWVCRSEAGFARRLAGAHEHLATLRYNIDDNVGEEPSIVSRLPWPVVSLAEDERGHQAKLSYWRAEYKDLTAASPLSGGNARDDAAEPGVMFIAANAAFRATLAEPADRTTTVDRLDRVLQAYSDVMRTDPDNSDAAYNYEYVSRFRDTVAKTKNPRTTKEAPRRIDGELDVSVDLPIGPTIHGRPGGPPQDLPMQQFRTVTPMRYEEREELEPGRGQRPKRRG